MLVPIPLPICNVFLLRGERPILIDTGRAADFAAVVKGLRKHGVAPADLALILHTHGHWDHCARLSFGDSPPPASPSTSPMRP